MTIPTQTIGHQSATCSHCGAVLGDRPFAKEGGSCCCEDCFLAQRFPLPERGAAADLYTGFVEALAEALDIRERETGLHSRRVGCHTRVLAGHFVSQPERLRQVYWGALLHDVGKIGIPDAILLKPGALTAAEWLIMQTHAEMGNRIVSRLPGMDEAAAIVRCHEERFDGSGYPRGLKGEAIPFGARLFAVIDTLDAMTSDRPYRQGLSFDVAKEEILHQTGIQFDPRVVEAFLAEEPTLREMVALKCGPEGMRPSIPGG